MAAQGAPTTAPATSTITELREQILANAMTLFPKAMREHRTRTRTFPYYVPDTDAFNISIVADDDEGSKAYSALLTHGERGNEKMAAIGGPGCTIESALRNLHDALAEGLSGTVDELFCSAHAGGGAAMKNGSTLCTKLMR